MANGHEPVRLQKIETLEDIADNFMRFQREARSHSDRSKRIFRRTEYWVRDQNGAFGPGKFLGYKNMDFLRYEQARAGSYIGTKFNGGTARLNIESALGREFTANESIESECRAWGENLLGSGAWGGSSAGKWKFLDVSIPGRELVSDFPDQITQPERFAEGAVKAVTVNAYERNRKARERCIEHHGVTCKVCGLNFEERYGEIGVGFIHVHHVKMLSLIVEEYEVDPIEDLLPVCPNCHAMLHRKSPPLTIQELRSRLVDVSH